MKRSRRGGRRPQHSNGGGHNNGGSHGGGFNPNRTFDSSGPEIKIRGSASHVYEKYLQLARDANSGGDRVMAENYLQHAEHYFRIMVAQQAQQAQYQAQQAAQNANRQPGEQPAGQQPQPAAPGSAPSFSLAESAADEEEGEDAEAVAMRFAARRAGACVARIAEVVQAVACPVAGAREVGAAGQLPELGGDVERDHVREDAARRVGILDDEDE